MDVAGLAIHRHHWSRPRCVDHATSPLRLGDGVPSLRRQWWLGASFLVLGLHRLVFVGSRKGLESLAIAGMVRGADIGDANRLVSDTRVPRAVHDHLLAGT